MTKLPTGPLNHIMINIEKITANIMIINTLVIPIAVSIESKENTRLMIEICQIALIKEGAFDLI